MPELQYTSLAEIEKVHATVYATFKAGTCRPLPYRRAQLHAVARMCQENIDALADALYADVAKPRQESLAFEVAGVVDHALSAAAALEEWVAPEAVVVKHDFQRAWGPRVVKTPKGPVLIIAPWNYPLVLCMISTIAAIASGNPAIVKPSELAPATAKLLAELFPRYLDPKAYIVVNGAVKETTKLLELKWAHIFYTGNGNVARIIAAAAAKHLTPVSLELGGKSPVLVDPAYDISLAAKRILFGKTSNAGQTCVAPDYVLVPRAHQAALVSSLKAHAAAFFPAAAGGALRSPSYSRIVNTRHFARLRALLARTKGTVVLGGDADEAGLRIAPTVVADVGAGDVLMQEEIFGPILPIIPVDSIDEAIDFINAHDKPLAFYAFTDDADLKQRLLDETISGSLIFNDTLMQISITELSFSGVGESGYGYQFHKNGFDAFTHNRSTLDFSKEDEQVLSIRYPPYSEATTKMLAAGAFQPIPA